MRYVWLAVVLALLLGCASTGTTQYNVDLARFDEVRFSDGISLFDQRYIPDIAKALKKHGFQIVTTQATPGTLECRMALEQQNIWNFRVHISLWDATHPLVVAEASNHGFGTLLAPETAVQNLVASAIERLKEELVKKGR